MTAKGKKTVHKPRGKPKAQTLSIPADSPHSAPQAAPPRFPIVGLGASAGGLEALQDFFSHMPPDSGMGFVVVTHQHPGHVSLLPNLLSKSTAMCVVEARDGLTVEPNHVYVSLPGGMLQISHGKLHRIEAESSKAPHLPIDYFLRSLATDQREHAICMVLSGTGSDGTLGMRAIKAESGMAMVQEPLSAKYTGMPSSAGATGLADYVLPPDAMPDQLIAYARGPYLKARPPAVETQPFPREPLERILTLLRSRTGHDFAFYKTTTIRRRIERRMNVHQIKEPQDYVRFLQENPHEIDMLFGELLIGVTGFFRDPQAFEALTEKAIPALLAARPDDRTLRVWTPGCASGEEAYSAAILLAECMEKLKRRLEVQIFGTDLDLHAIEAARAGIYPAGISAEVSPQRLERFFTKEDGVYRVRKEIREMLVFAIQNVIKDPPFTKLDLICCRNLLIYLDTELQRRLLPTFHYALRPGGLLFLGSSESIGGFGDLFETIDGKWKIYRRRETAAAVQPFLNLPKQPLEMLAPGPQYKSLLPHSRQTQTAAVVERLLLNRFAPTALVVNEQGAIVYIHGRTGSYLEPTEGQPRNNLLEMARQGLERPLTAALRQAAAEKRAVARTRVRVKTNGDYAYVDFSVLPIEDPEPIRGLLLVTISPAVAPEEPAKKRRGKKTDEQPGRAEELERELQYLKESHQTTVEELETSNEELKSINEELQSTNEEMQSTNEELETSKEEMQSLNEELSTVNTELEAKVYELSRATDDMLNLLNSTQVATIFLDNQLNVKRYTEQAKELFNLIQTDVGRPLADLASNLNYDRLSKDCGEVLRSLERKEFEVGDRNGGWHLMRILPYRTADNIIDGVVVTFVDITRIKRAEEEAEAFSQCFKDILRTAREPLLVLDSRLRVISASAGFCRLSQVEHNAVLGKGVYDLADGFWDVPAMHELLEKVVQQQTDVAGFEIAHDFPRLGQRVFKVHAYRLQSSSGTAEMIALSLGEVTKKQQE